MRLCVEYMFRHFVWVSEARIRLTNGKPWRHLGVLPNQGNNTPGPGPGLRIFQVFCWKSVLILNIENLTASVRFNLIVTTDYKGITHRVTKYALLSMFFMKSLNMQTLFVHICDKNVNSNAGVGWTNYDSVFTIKITTIIFSINTHLYF